MDPCQTVFLEIVFPAKPQQPLVIVHLHLCPGPTLPASLEQQVLSSIKEQVSLIRELTSWPSSATPHPNTTASIGGAVTKLGRSAHRLPTEEDCLVNDFDKLLGFLLGALLDDLDVGVNVSGTFSSVLCTISEQDLT